MNFIPIGAYLQFSSYRYLMIIPFCLQYVHHVPHTLPYCVRSTLIVIEINLLNKLMLIQIEVRFSAKNLLRITTCPTATTTRATASASDQYKTRSFIISA